MSRSNYVVLACCFVFALALLHINQYTLISDDLWFSERSITEPDHIKWLISRYFEWSSRTPIEYALISLINKFNVWALLNSFMFSLLVVGIYSMNGSISNNDLKIAPVIVTLVLLLSIPRDIFFNGSIWITGSFNYLWPAALAFFGYSLLISTALNKSNLKRYALTCYICIFFSSFNEQIAITNVIITLSIIIYCKINDNNTYPEIISLSITLLVLIYIATCPGNKARYYGEIATWFKEYGSFNILQKAMLGLNLYVDMLIAEKSLVPAATALSIGLICNEKTKTLPIAAGLIMLFLSAIPTPPQALQVVKLTGDNIFSAMSIYRVLFSLLITSLIVIPVILSQKTSLLSFLITAMIAGAGASTSMLGFSPTVYASGNRILYIPYLLFIAAAVTAFTMNSKGESTLQSLDGK